MKTLVLDSTSKTIKVVMSGAAATTNPDFVSTWAENNGTLFTEGSTDGALNGTTAVTLVAAPSAGYRRVVKAITIYNRDTAAITITLSLDNGGTLRQFAKVTLQVGDIFTTDGTFNSAGSLKTVVSNVNLATEVLGVLSPANGGTGVANNSASTLTISGAHPTTVTVTGTTSVTLPTSGTLIVAGKAIALSSIFGF
jgi:hypothetical protein